MHPATAPDPRNGLARTLPADLRASVVVFLVALPLCIAIALASIPPEYPQAGQAAYIGILTGIIGGLVVSWLAGSPLQVSGPAAGLIVIIVQFLHSHRDDPERGYAIFAAGLVVAGVVQVASGLFRLGQVFRAVSPAVIHGMLAGIGVVILASQFHVMLDDDRPREAWENLLTIPQALLAIFDREDTNDLWAARIGLTTILAMVFWQTFAPKALQFLPAPLIGVLVATTEAAFLKAEVPGLSVTPVPMPTDGSLLDAVTLPQLHLLTGWAEWREVLTLGLTVALVASAESLLCAAAVDQMHTGPRTKFDRELWAQGVGNALCGLLGAMPMTGVIVRSAANVNAGAKTRLSAALHGLWLLTFVALVPALVALVPRSSLAAILVLTGWKLISFKTIRWLWEFSKGEVAVYLVTVVTIVATDLLVGVGVGVVLSAFKLLFTFSRLTVQLQPSQDGSTTDMFLRGTATFLRLPTLAGALEEVPPATHLHVHLDQLNYIDHACLDLLMNWEKQHRASGGTLSIDWDNLRARFREPRQTVPEGRPGEPPQRQPPPPQPAVTHAQPGSVNGSRAAAYRDDGADGPRY